MASSAAPPRPWTLARPTLARRSVVLAGLAALAIVAISIYVRTREADAGLWVDEGLSFGIADRPIGDIPGIMRQDGSPPLYYLLLHIFTRTFGVRGPIPLHLFSLAFATLLIPVAFVLANTLFGRRAAWIAALLAAFNPFLSIYAQEARMYSMAVLLSFIACACFVAAFALKRGRGWTIGYGVTHAVLLYTHNWALFLGLGLTAAFVVLAALDPEPRPLIREGLIAVAIIFVLYLPWIPTLLFQIRHTGAPWAQVPPLSRFLGAPQDLLGYAGQYLLLLIGGYGLTRIARGPVHHWPREARAALALIVASVVTLAVPWLLSQASPTWSLRYLAVAVGPLILLATIGLSRAGALGVACAIIVALTWSAKNAPATKSNVHSVTEAIAPSLQPGDTIISTQPEGTPVIHYYLHKVPGLKWATLWGPLTELGVTDWRDGTSHLQHTSVAKDLEPVLNAVAPGHRVVLMEPDFSVSARWKAPWSSLVRERSLEWEDAMSRDPRFRVVTVEPPNPVRRTNEVRATVYVRQPIDSRP